MKFCAALILFLLVAACAKVPAADAIRAAIMSMAAAAEKGKGADLIEHVSEDFVGNDGEVDRAGLANLLRAHLLTASSISVRIGRIDVDLDGERATARFDADVTDGSGRWIADRRAVLHLTTGWRRERGTWRCYNARWNAPD